MDSHNIDCEKSIRKNRLVFRDFFQEYEPASFYIILFLALALYSRFIIEGADLTAVNDRFIVFGVMPMVCIGVLFLAYRKTTERKFYKISTATNRELTRQNIKDILRKRGWAIEYENENYLIANTGSDFFASGEQMTIIYRDNYLLMNVLKNYKRGRMPSILGYKKLAINIEKEIQI